MVLRAGRPALVPRAPGARSRPFPREPTLGPSRALPTSLRAILARLEAVRSGKAGSSRPSRNRTDSHGYGGEALFDPSVAPPTLRRAGDDLFRPTRRRLPRRGKRAGTIPLASEDGPSGGAGRDFLPRRSLSPRILPRVPDLGLENALDDLCCAVSTARWKGSGAGTRSAGTPPGDTQRKASCDLLKARGQTFCKEEGGRRDSQKLSQEEATLQQTFVDDLLDFQRDFLTTYNGAGDALRGYTRPLTLADLERWTKPPQ
jgi:hypothetical protein